MVFRRGIDDVPLLFTNSSVTWVILAGKRRPTATWQGIGTTAATTTAMQGQQLYDCSVVAAK